MGLMLSRRRKADAKKQIAVNKAKAHAANHKAAHAAYAAEEAARAGAGAPAKQKAESANVDKLGTK